MPKKHNRKALSDALDELAKLYPDGELIMSTCPEDFVAMVIKDIKQLRDVVGNEK
jgi:hypothetical protein